MESTARSTVSHLESTPIRGSRTSRVRAVGLGWILMLFVAFTPGCAATAGAIVGPITGPVTTWRHTYGMPMWFKPFVVPLAVILGPVLGFVEGARCDTGFLVNGEYGVDGHPPFRRILDPAGPRTAGTN